MTGAGEEVSGTNSTFRISQAAQLVGRSLVLISRNVQIPHIAFFVEFFHLKNIGSIPQTKVARKTGFSAKTIVNPLRLNNLPM